MRTSSLSICSHAALKLAYEIASSLSIFLPLIYNHLEVHSTPVLERFAVREPLQSVMHACQPRLLLRSPSLSTDLLFVLLAFFSSVTKFLAYLLYIYETVIALGVLFKTPVGVKTMLVKFDFTFLKVAE